MYSVLVSVFLALATGSVPVAGSRAGGMGGGYDPVYSGAGGLFMQSHGVTMGLCDSPVGCRSNGGPCRQGHGCAAGGVGVKRVMASVYGGRRGVHVAPWGDTAHCILVSGRLIWFQEGYSQGGS